MSEYADKALLPAGLSDVLPPEADYEARVTEYLMAEFQARGYDRIKPPLIEFEKSLLSGNGVALSSWTFRVMDPESRKMMGLRPDMTTQAARIAATRLAKAPRPLRLSYSGQVLRVKGSQLRPERQFGQAGVELIGSVEADADAEVIRMAAETLETVGVSDISVDMGLPTLVPAIIEALDLDADTGTDLRSALDRKDQAGVRALEGKIGNKGTELIDALIDATGPAAAAMKALGALDLPSRAAAELEQLVRVIGHLNADSEGLNMTVDPVENRGFEYHSGVTFSIFAKNVRGELGRGGRYRIDRGSGEEESATGFTLFMDSVLRALPPAKEEDARRTKRVFLPTGTANGEASKLRAEGWTTISGLSDCPDPSAEARRLGCSHWFNGGTIQETGA